MNCCDPLFLPAVPSHRSSGKSLECVWCSFHNNWKCIMSCIPACHLEACAQTQLYTHTQDQAFSKVTYFYVLNLSAKMVASKFSFHSGHYTRFFMVCHLLSRSAGFLNKHRPDICLPSQSRLKLLPCFFFPLGAEGCKKHITWDLSLTKI